MAETDRSTNEKPGPPCHARHVAGETPSLADFAVAFSKTLK